jgi:hypothetical protein
MDMTSRIANSVRQIDRLRADKANLWAKASKLVAEGHTEEAISLLNRYFSLEEELLGAEASLASTLKGYFTDR